MRVENTGNLIIKDVAIASTLPLVYNTTAVTDSLTLGEVVVMEANITYNNSMIRDPNKVVWTNISYTSVAENETVTSQITIVPVRCTDNTTAGNL